MQTGVSYPPDQPVESEDREIYQFDSNSIESKAILGNYLVNSAKNWSLR